MSVREELPAPTSPSASLTRWQRLGPILLLLFFAPLSGELLSGATRLSYIFVLIPEIVVWGVGALLIREAVRRTRRGWPSLISLGLALGVAEECAIQQTSFSPIVGLDSLHIYGRVFGVNWVWFFALIIFECVWIVLVPVQVVELLFPSRRNHPWLRSRGIVISSVVFLLGSCIAWYLWTQRARPIAFHVPIYTPPLAYILAGLVVILILIAIAFSFRADSGPPIIAARRAPVPIVTGIAAAILSVPAFLFIGLNFMPRRLPPSWISIAAGIVWAVLALAIIRFWAASPAWSDMHRYALVFGALIACMASSYASPGWLRLDFIGKVVINVVAVILLILLGFVLKRRSAL